MVQLKNLKFRNIFTRIQKKKIFFISVYMSLIVQLQLFSFFILLLFETVWISIQLSAITSFFMGLVPFYTCLAVFHLLVSKI